MKLTNSTSLADTFNSLERSSVSKKSKKIEKKLKNLQHVKWKQIDLLNSSTPQSIPLSVSVRKEGLLQHRKQKSDCVRSKMWRFTSTSFRFIAQKKTEGNAAHFAHVCWALNNGHNRLRRISSEDSVKGTSSLSWGEWLDLDKLDRNYSSSVHPDSCRVCGNLYGYLLKMGPSDGEVFLPGWDRVFDNYPGREVSPDDFSSRTENLIFNHALTTDIF